mmetsp:Transcript_3187/g.4918  ORF Transcript_3187/g.4918 Transcript_3187/m.4918 type:complete len:154 (-) Transcript_3187:2962-3423(-)
MRFLVGSTYWQNWQVAGIVVIIQLRIQLRPRDTHTSNQTTTTHFDALFDCSYARCPHPLNLESCSAERRSLLRNRVLNHHPSFVYLFGILFMVSLSSKFASLPPPSPEMIDIFMDLGDRDLLCFRLTLLLSRSTIARSKNMQLDARPSVFVIG